MLAGAPCWKTYDSSPESSRAVTSSTTMPPVPWRPDVFTGPVAAGGSIDPPPNATRQVTHEPAEGGSGPSGTSLRPTNRPPRPRHGRSDQDSRPPDDPPAVTPASGAVPSNTPA